MERTGNRENTGRRRQRRLRRRPVTRATSNMPNISFTRRRQASVAHTTHEQELVAFDRRNHTELDSRANTVTNSDQVRMVTPQGSSTSVVVWAAHLEQLDRIATVMQREMSDLDIAGAFLNVPAPVNEYVDDGTL